MTSMWISLLLVLLHLSNGFKLPRADLKGLDGYTIDHPTMEDTSISSSPTARLFQWLPETSRRVPSALKHNSSKVSRMKREIASAESDYLDEFTTSPTLEEESTYETATMKSHTMDGDSTPTSLALEEESTYETATMKSHVMDGDSTPTSLALEEESTYETVTLKSHAIDVDSTTTSLALEDESTYVTVTIKSHVIDGDSTKGPKPTHHADVSQTQTELIEIATSHIFTHSSSSSTIIDKTSNSAFGISEDVTYVTSPPISAVSHPSETIHPTLTSVTEHSASNYSTGLVDAATRPSDIPTSAPVDNLTATSSLNLSHAAKPHSTETTSTTDANNSEDGQSEKQNPMTSLMGQCLLAISILALIATVFIICTIVLATKLSNLKHNYKLLTKNSTEMVCISALLPDSDQAAAKNKARMNKMKTFATNVEECDGDNLTLNSFLPDH